MIYSVSGKLVNKQSNFVVINSCGIGFKIYVSPVTLSKLGKKGAKVEIFTYLYNKEDSMDLYGFLDERELRFFEALISVSGIGPKSAMGILGIGSVTKLSAAISQGEIELLQKSSGIGRKTAERIILELKDKISRAGASGEEVTKIMQSDSDVYDALVSLGYSSRQAKTVLSKIDPKLTGVDDRLRDALKKIK